LQHLDPEVLDPSPNAAAALAGRSETAVAVEMDVEGGFAEWATHERGIRDDVSTAVVASWHDRRVRQSMLDFTNATTHRH
jgi:hypothetical protein